MPLEATIRQLLAPYCPGGRARATGKQTTMKKYAYFAGRFNGHGNAPVRYRMHYLMKEAQDFTRSHWTPPLGESFLRY